MSDIFRYIQKYQNRSLQELPFTHIDALLMAQLSYIDYKDILTQYKQADFKTIVSYLDLQELEKDYLSGGQNQRLLLALAHAKRYQDVKLIDTKKVFDQVKQEQFYAVTFKYKRQYYIAFQGTDTSILGWKEDFNMLIEPVIPAQAEGVNYLEKMLKRPFIKAIIIGHSKGGSIATYAALQVSKHLQKKIDKVYSLDGPGLQSELCMDSIKDKFEKFVPQASLIGLIFEKTNHYKIIKSDEVWLAQHNLYSWLIEDTDFVYVDAMDERLSQINKSAYEALTSLQLEERKAFIQHIFDILDTNEITDVGQLGTSWQQISLMLVKSFSKVDKEKRDALLRILKMILTEIINNRNLLKAK